MRGQQPFRNSLQNPSGPGDLMLGNSAITWLISILLKGVSSPVNSSELLRRLPRLKSMLLNYVLPNLSLKASQKWLAFSSCWVTMFPSLSWTKAMVFLLFVIVACAWKYLVPASPFFTQFIFPLFPVSPLLFEQWNEFGAYDVSEIPFKEGQVSKTLYSI